MEYANYLPDELLLEILEYIEAWEIKQRQPSLARFCSVSRQWYDVGIRKLYEQPYLTGRAYELFVRTCCPSVLAHIKPSALSGLVRVLDLSHIVHQSTKATTAREFNDPTSQLQKPGIDARFQDYSDAPSPPYRFLSPRKPRLPSTAGRHCPNAFTSASWTSASSANVSRFNPSIKLSASYPTCATCTFHAAPRGTRMKRQAR
jgi:hypothetical protein